MPSPIPSTSPSSSRDAARRLERSHRIIGSPENRRLPTDPSTNLLGVQPVDLSTRLSSIPPPQHDSPQASTSALTLAPPPLITSMAAPAPPSHRQTLNSTQLRAAFAALPPLNPPMNSSTRQSFIPPPQHDGPQAPTSAFTLAPPPLITSMAAPAPPSHRQTHSSTQLRAAFAALPPLNPSHRHQPVLTSAFDSSFEFIEHNVCI
jgi:hypothetical protein